ncbi:peptidylprolyl isomerase [Candidatus Woesearchaeota archaeon]|jgi:peptidylprolyl isomerase|nr:peptidylprolyl isomerase [Candidatus Woesearchaeota archaeon]MBT4335959.1 peptidylprolyl isomerase [Candidatus Woesearchaeota archaeon]MBT4469062.1 peptidylprolyl isomerase [Candidatus Woesearchaeota archaeon]MBT6744619.1 peptidylprolyl isomerase [Candidatus Woesearchaeota archaeon]
MKKILIIGLMVITLFLLSCGGEKMTNKTATFHTTLGTFEIELFEEQMPITTKNFIALAEKGFYDDTKFHRVISGFMIQGGDPLSKDNSKKHMWGTGDPGYKIKDEFGDVGNNKGTISMANSGPNSGGSQFFVNLVNNNFLDSKHPVFGKVTNGMNIVENIGKVQTAQADQPVEDVVIEKIVIS